MSMMEARLGSSAMRHPWWQSSDGIDLDQPFGDPIETANNPAMSSSR
jgi:hypothetical protein